MEEVRLRVSAPLYYIYKIKSTQPEVDSGSAGRMWTRRCNARLGSSLYAYGEEIRQGFLTCRADTGLAWLEGRYWKTDI